MMMSACFKHATSAVKAPQQETVPGRVKRCPSARATAAPPALLRSL